MVFEKVTLSVDQKADQKVVKIGFLNIATNHWITVNEQGIVTLQVNLYNNSWFWKTFFDSGRAYVLKTWQGQVPVFFFEAHTFFYVYVRETDLGHVVQKKVFRKFPVDDNK